MKDLGLQKEVIRRKYGKIIRYLFKAYSLREYCNEKPYDHFRRMKQDIWEQIVLKKRKQWEYPDEEAHYRDFEEAFTKKHGLVGIHRNFPAWLVDDLVRLLVDYLEESQAKSATIRVVDVEDLLKGGVIEEAVRGISANPGLRVGTARILLDENVADMLAQVKQGEVLIIRDVFVLNPEVLERSSAIVLERGGSTSHPVLQARGAGKPAIIGARNATQVLKNGTKVLVLAKRWRTGRQRVGIVYRFCA